MKKLIRTRTLNTIIACIAVSILLLFLLSYTDNRNTALFETETPTAQRPNFFLINSHSSKFDKQGNLELTAYSEHIKHNPVDNSASMRTPKILTYRQGDLDWTISAHHGIAFNGNKKIQLSEQVIALSSDQKTTLKTPELTIFPNKKLAETDKVVEVVNIHGTTESIGLKANLKTKKISLLSHVKSQYKPNTVSEYAQ